ncbi:hypothetical protein [Cryobacterium sp. AP23]
MTRSATLTRQGADRLHPAARWLAVLLVPFLVVATVLLYVFPTRTEVLFAWTIAPPLSALFLACAYIGGIWFFVRVVRETRWHRVRRGFAAVLVFATLLGAATVLHWDRFHQGTFIFVVWATLYVTTPFLSAAVLGVHRGLDDGRPEERDFLLPVAVRAVLVTVGVAALAAGLALFILPVELGPLWAWELTPLTARVVGAVLTLPGMVNVWMIRDARWSSFRKIFQAQILSLMFILLALILGRDALTGPSALLVVTGLGFSFVAYVTLYVFCERRLRAAPAP